MLSYKININEFNKIKRNTIRLRKNLVLKKDSDTRQRVIPRVYGLSVIVPVTNINANHGYVIENASEDFELSVKDSNNNTIIVIEPTITKYIMFNGTSWVETSDFIQYIQIPIGLTSNNDMNLGYGDFVENTVGTKEIEKIIPPTVDLEKVKFKPIYPEIKIILWFAQFDEYGKYTHHSHEFPISNDSGLPFAIEGDYFESSYLQMNYYLDNLVQGNSLIDYKQFYFDSRWLEYNLSGNNNTSMLVQKPYNHSYNININNYYFYYYVDLFETEKPITLYFNAEFKNTRTGKSQLFTTTAGGIITDTNGTVDKNKLYSTITLKYGNNNSTYSFADIDTTNNQLNFYETING